MKKLLIILLLPVMANAQLSKASLNAIITRDIAPPNAAYSSLKTSKLLDSLVLSLALVGGGGGGGTYGGASPTTATVGGLAAGTAISGSTYDAIFQAILVPFVAPVFNSFAVTGLSNTVEVGNTLSGSKTFTWTTTANSGTITTIDIFDNTASANLVTGLSNTGSTSHSVTTNQLNTNGASQSWKAVGHYTGGGSGTMNSSNFVTTGRYFDFWGPSPASVTNSSTVRALPSSQFQLAGNSFTLNTGTSLTKFIICLPPSVTLVSVIDNSALGANITASFIAQSNINVLDAGSTNRSYNIYEFNVGSPYGSSHNLTCTTN